MSPACFTNTSAYISWEDLHPRFYALPFASGPDLPGVSAGLRRGKGECGTQSTHVKLPSTFLCKNDRVSSLFTVMGNSSCLVDLVETSGTYEADNNPLRHPVRPVARICFVRRFASSVIASEDADYCSSATVQIEEPCPGMLRLMRSY